MSYMYIVYCVASLYNTCIVGRLETKDDLFFSLLWTPGTCVLSDVIYVLGCDIILIMHALGCFEQWRPPRRENPEESLAISS